MLHIKLKKIINAATVYQLFCLQPSPHPPIHPQPSSTFSEHAHVAYQSKGNHECTYMVAHILPADPPPLTLVSKCQNSTFLQNMIMLHIKLTGITKKRNIQLFQNIDMLHIKFIGITKCSNLEELFCPQNLSPPPPPPVKSQLLLQNPRPSPLTLAMGVNRSKVNFFSEQCNVAYQIKVNYECSNMVTLTLPVDSPPH